MLTLISSKELCPIVVTGGVNGAPNDNNFYTGLPSIFVANYRNECRTEQNILSFPQLVNLEGSNSLELATTPRCGETHMELVQMPLVQHSKMSTMRDECC